MFWSFILGTSELVGESTLLGGQLREFPNMCIKIHLQNVLHLILGFTFSVWAWYFDFQKVNAM